MQGCVLARVSPRCCLSACTYPFGSLPLLPCLSMLHSSCDLSTLIIAICSTAQAGGRGRAQDPVT